MCERVWNEGVHLGHFRSGAIDENDQLAITMDTVVRFGLEFPFSPRRLWRNGDKTRTTSVKCSASTRSGTEPMWGGPVAALASSHRQQFGRHVRPARVKFMLSLALRARRTHPPPLGVVHSHSSVRHLARWLPRRSGKLPPPPLRGVAGGGGARSFAAYSIALAFGAGVGFTAYENYQPFRHTILAVVRCSRVAGE